MNLSYIRLLTGKSSRPRMVGMALLLGVLLTIACGAERDDSGQIVGAGDVEVDELRLGDCFDDPSPMTEQVTDLRGIPCGEPHENEVYHVFDLEEEGSWPGGDTLNSIGFDECFATFEPFVGAPYDSSRLDIGWIVPSKFGWEVDDDRQILCLLFDVRLELLSGSMRGSGE